MKFKKILVTFFMLIMVICCSFSVSAYTSNRIFNIKGGIGTTDTYRNGEYVTTYAFKTWAYVSTMDKDHYDSYKLARCTSFKIDSNDSYKTYSIKMRQGTKRSYSTDNVLFNGSVAKIEYFGKIHRTSEKSTKVLQYIKIRVFRSGCPVK